MPGSPGTTTQDADAELAHAGHVTEDPHHRTASTTALAFGLLAAALALVTVAVVGSALTGLGLGGAVESFVVTNSVMGLAFPACGVLLAWQRPRNPVGWLLIADGLGHATTAAMVPLLDAGVAAGWPDPVLRSMATLMDYAWPWSIAVFLPLALLLFPDGRLVSPRWRWWVWITVLTSPLFVLSAGAEPAAVNGVDSWLELPGYTDFAPLWTVAEIRTLVVFLAALTALVIRYRRGDERLRGQLLWLALAVGLVVVVVLVPWGLLQTGPVLILLAIPLIPAAMVVAILRHQLLDIRLVVSRAVLYGLMTAGVIGVYIGLVAAFDVVLRREVGLGTSVLATVVVAVAFNPVRVRAQRLVDRGFYGDRSDPARAAARVGTQLAGAGLADVPAVVCQALRLPFAALRTTEAELAAHGTIPEHLHAVPLDYGGERTGELVVGLRRGEQRLDAADRGVLELLAVPLAVAVRATALSDAVQRSREQLVTAREEERRRLRRDLHDGLGPVLTGVAFQADAARNLLASDPARADELVASLRAEVGAAIDSVRRLVYGLRPPTLDELGLVRALEHEAERLVPLRVEIVAESLPTLPAAVEVAAYRIAMEALTNAARHAHASEVRLVLRCGTDLDVEITDDGPGNGDGPRWRQGVGMRSMTERAAELGGWCTAGPSATGGVVRAALPLTGPRATEPGGAR